MFSSSSRWSRVTCITTRACVMILMHKSKSLMETILVTKAPINKCNPKCKRCRTLSRISKTRSASFRICSTRTWPIWKTKSENRTSWRRPTLWNWLLPKSSWRSSKIKPILLAQKLKFQGHSLNSTILAIIRRNASNSLTTFWYLSKRDLSLSKKSKSRTKNGLICMSAHLKT